MTATALALALVAAWIPTARRLGLVARPGGRRQHATPTPCAGAAVVLAALAAASLGGLPGLAWIWAGGLAVIGLGLLDDRFGVGVLFKLSGQIAAASLPVIGGGLGPGLISVPGFGLIDLGTLRGPLWILAIVVAMNIMNLIDGHDGLASGLAVIGSATMASLAYVDGRPGDAVLPIAIAAACLMFLVWNRPPARAFLGDQGSLGLGYLLAVAALTSGAKTGAALGLAGGLMALAIPLADALAVATYRLRAGRSPWSADRSHLHHRLARRGVGPWRILVSAWGAAAAWGAYAISLRLWFPKAPQEIALAALIGACLAVVCVLGLKPVRWERPSRGRSVSHHRQLTENP